MSLELLEIDERTNLTAKNKFELLLFRLGESAGSDRRELFGINVFKVREIMVMPKITMMVNAPPTVLGVASIRDEVIPVIDLPSVVGCRPKNGNQILLITEYSRSTQGFAVEDVSEIMRLNWDQVLSAEGNGGRLVTSIAKLDDDHHTNPRLAQVLDVEQVLREVMPSKEEDLRVSEKIGATIQLPEGTVILAADDSPLARQMITNGLASMEVPVVMTHTGLEAWKTIQAMSDEAQAEGKTIADKVALVLTDLEMPEMDGFTLTRKLKDDPRFKSIPVVIHSSLTGGTNHGHIRAAGADAYVGKFVANELAATVRQLLNQREVQTQPPLAELSQ